MNQSQDSHHEHMEMPHSIPRGLLRFLIFRLLQSKDMTGTEIMSVLEERSQGAWRPSPGSMYPMLATLEEKGFIETVKTEGRSKTYRLSEEGHIQTKEHFKRAGDLEHKARLSRILWINLLEPCDRANFLLTGMKASMDALDDTIQHLKKSERTKLQKRASVALNHLEKLTSKLKLGDAYID